MKAALPDVPIPAAVWQTPWVVYCKPTVQGSAAVLRYLARYVHRAAITDARIIAVPASQVTFSYKDAHAHQWRRMTLGGEEFLRRFLQHVLPPGFHKVRYYGLWAPAAQPTRGRLQHQLGGPSEARPPNAAAALPIVTLSRAAAAALPPCPQCATGTLHLVRHLAPCRGADAKPP